MANPPSLSLPPQRALPPLPDAKSPLRPQVSAARLSGKTATLIRQRQQVSKSYLPRELRARLAAEPGASNHQPVGAQQTVALIVDTGPANQAQARPLEPLTGWHAETASAEYITRIEPDQRGERQKAIDADVLRLKAAFNAQSAHGESEARFQEENYLNFLYTAHPKKFEEGVQRGRYKAGVPAQPKARPHIPDGPQAGLHENLATVQSKLFGLNLRLMHTLESPQNKKEARKLKLLESHLNARIGKHFNSTGLRTFYPVLVPQVLARLELVFREIDRSHVDKKHMPAAELNAKIADYQRDYIFAGMVLKEAELLASKAGLSEVAELFREYATAFVAWTDLMNNGSRTEIATEKGYFQDALEVTAKIMANAPAKPAQASAGTAAAATVVKASAAPELLAPLPSARPRANAVAKLKL